MDIHLHWKTRGKALKISLTRPVPGANAFRNSSLGTKLSVVVLATTSLALLLAGAGIFSYETSQARTAAEHELESLAEIVSRSSTAALTFSDAKAAADTLASLEGDGRLLQATMYDRNGLFARYKAARASIAAPPVIPRKDGIYLDNGILFIFHPVMLGTERVGTVLLQSSMSEAQQRLRRYAGIVALDLGASLVIAFLAVARLRRIITEPIASLADVARRVSEEKDYSIRASKQAEDEIGQLIDSFNDMLSHIQRGQLALRESEERYALAAQGANDGLWDWKPETGQIYLSARWKIMLGYAESEIHPDPEEWFSRVHPADLEALKSEMTSRPKGAEPVFSAEYRIRTKGGFYIWALCRGIAIRNAAGTIVRMAGSQTDITEGKVVDPLTGLRTRLYFLDRLDLLTEDPTRTKDTFAVLFLDLDRFKVVNDSMGHDAGDRLLSDVASRLQSVVRDTDVTARLGASSTVARFGGDEFAILLEKIRNKAEAGIVASRIVGQFALPFNIGSQLVFTTVSIGVAMGNSAKTSRDLLTNADTAMYYAKTRGKARFEIFSDEMRDKAVARMELESDLRTAVSENQFLVYYQPEVLLDNEKVVGYEALVRWNHPRRGVVPPAEFLPVAEETGLIVPLGMWVMEQACREMAKWQSKFPLDPFLTISVNLSAKELANPALLDNVARILKETGLKPKSLRIEATETSLFEDKNLALSVLRRLRELNVSLEIDDFGTGYSSLSRLREFPFDRVKIDRSFVTDIKSGTGSKRFVETMLQLAHSLGMDVVAEGVETREQLDVLATLGCNYVQGYYFSKPVEGQAIEDIIQNRSAMESAAFRSQLLLPAAPSATEDTSLVGPGVDPAVVPG